MSDTAQPSQATQASALLVPLAVAALGGYYAASGILHLAMLRGHLGQGAPRILDEAMPLGAVMAILLVLEARPRGWRQFGLVLMLAVPLAIWLKLAEVAAFAVQYEIAEQGSLFILLPAFAMLALPAMTPAWLKLKRAGMLWRPTGKLLPEGSIGLFEAVAIALPGLLAAFLVIDLLRAFAWLPADLNQAFSWTILHLAFSVLAVTIAARPAGRRQWTILGGTLAAVLIVTTLASAGMEPAFHEPPRPGVRLSPGQLPPLLVAVAIGFAARTAVHRLAGRHSPWPW